MADHLASTGRHGLGPHVVGQRVVVRRLLPGQTGPSGGPAMTDVLGVCERWADGVAAVRREDGTLLEIKTADIVSGKPVPPRPSPRMRVSAEEVELRAVVGLTSGVVEHLGDWVLRTTGGTTGRTNSVLAVGEPGIPLDRAIRRVLDFYAGHDRPAWAQVILDSDQHRAFEDRGWTRARPDQADVDMLLGSLTQVRRRIGPTEHEVRIVDRISRDWLVGSPGALADYDRVAAQLGKGAGDEVAFAAVGEGGDQLARGRAVLAGDWLVVTDLLTRPDQRRKGLSRTVLATLLDWGAERGATTVQLQVLSDNRPAQALYDSLGLRRHHSYCYLAAPASG